MPYVMWSSNHLVLLRIVSCFLFGGVVTKADSGYDIWGGTDAEQHEFPFYAASIPTSEIGPACGGSLIWKDIVLSACHCGENDEEASAFADGVIVGAWKRDNLHLDGAEFRAIEKEVPHPDCELDSPKGEARYDYLVMKLDSPITSIYPVELNREDSNPYSGQRLTAIGFGKISDNPSTYPDTLQKVDMPAVSHDYCAKIWENEKFGYGIEIIENVMVCAGAVGSDACAGDSGGPLLDQKGRLVGLTSFGYAFCESQTLPGVYARVSGVIDWIDKQICNLSDYPPRGCPQQ